MSKRLSAPETPADVRVRELLDRNTSFVMLAGAGSGKTTSLVKALTHILATRGEILKSRGQKVACITYTEVAKEEIWKDVGGNPLCFVTTIHSFLWSLIRPFSKDINACVAQKIGAKIEENKAKLTRPKVQAATKVKAEAEIERLTATLDILPNVPSFTYGTGSDYRKGILGHNDVQEIAPLLILSKPLLRSIVARTFPFIFVDECQDTFVTVVESLTAVQQASDRRMCLGFLGDPMQKIYPHGVGKIELREGWEEVKKPENFRCPPTVLAVINSIRKDDDGLVQVAGKKWGFPGSVKLFLASNESDRTATLEKVREIMARELDEPRWLSSEPGAHKVLVLVHKAAAERLGFPSIFAAFHYSGAEQGLKDDFEKGQGWILSPLLQIILPLAAAQSREKPFDVISLLRSFSPALEPDALKARGSAKVLGKIKESVISLEKMLSDDSTFTVLEVIKSAVASNVIELDRRWAPFVDGGGGDSEEFEYGKATQAFGACPARELWAYQRYILEESPFSTQHGIKGAEFERVITILDDGQSSHNQYSYDKLLELAPLSETDQKNIAAGVDSVLGRTRRLFYVSCSRAERDLAVLLFTDDPSKASQATKILQIFSAKDIRVLNGG